jgi:CRP/FNR family transcriptional regulator, cyclic AMP receptor protein
VPLTTEQRLEVLRNAAMFAGLDEAQIRALDRRLVPRRFSRDQVVFEEGQPAQGLYIIARGAVRIYKTSAEGREQVLAVERAGYSVAEIPLFDGGPYPASVAALENSDLLFLSRQDFEALCREHPQITLKVLEVVGRRLRQLVSIIEELSFRTVRHRLAALLVEQAEASGAQTDDGIEFTLAVTNQEIAARIGTVRELVSRTLGQFEGAELIERRGRAILVPDLEALRAVAGRA